MNAEELVTERVISPSSDIQSMESEVMDKIDTFILRIEIEEENNDEF